MTNSTTSKKVFPSARLSIFIKGCPVIQGKYYTLNGKPVFLVNIDDNKLFYNYNGYSISCQILETFSVAKLRPLILYKHLKKNIVYQTTPSVFNKKGILVSYGSHRQSVLPINKWKIFKGDLQEPYNLPSMSVDQWLKPPVRTLHVDPEQYNNSRLRLKELFLQKFDNIKKENFL